MSWIQVPFISSTTHPNDPDNGTLALHDDESIEELIANEQMEPDSPEPELFPSDSDDDDDLDNYQYYNQRVARIDPDYNPNDLFQ